MKPKRRNYLINKPFQFGHVGNLLLLQALGVAVSGALIAWITLIVLNRRLVSGLDATFLMEIGIILLVLAAGVALWAVKSSHAIAGPVWKAGKIMRLAAAGELPERPVGFRRGDAFKELATDLNLLLDSMRADRAKLDALPRELRALADSLSAGAITRGECREALAEMAREIELSRDSGGAISI